MDSSSQEKQSTSPCKIVRAIVTLAHNLGLDVTAEGIETPEQLAGLRELGCESGQGYLFSKPVDAESAEALIAAQPRW
jgi:EAL domain-containing protein (putative c-di-GMP-specific phosphodiesterase class I)